MRTLAALTLLAGSAAAAAPVPKHLMKPPETAQAKLQGEWNVEAIRLGELDILAALGRQSGMSFEFRDDALIAVTNTGDTVKTTTATVTWGTDGQIRATNQQTADGTGKLIDGPQDSALGYALDGDKLLLATRSDWRQAADPLRPGPNDMVFTLTRAKK